MKTLLDLLGLTAIFLNLVLAVFVVWLGLCPDLSLADFFSQSQRLTLFLPLLLIPAAVVVFILGKDPRHHWARRFRERVVVPAFLTEQRVTWLLVVNMVVMAGQLWYLVQLYRNPFPDFTNLLLEDDLEGAFDSTTNTASASQQAFRTNVAECFLQAERRLSRSESETDTRAALQFVERHPQAFRPLWTRYLLAYAAAKGHLALGDLASAMNASVSAAALARRLNDGEGGRQARFQGTLYLRDIQNTLKPTQEERLKAARNLFVRDPSSAGQRQLGTVFYMEKNYLEACRAWTNALAACSASDVAQRKMLHNNLAMAYLAMQLWIPAEEALTQGIRLAFDVEMEDQRREQIRLLATQTAMLSNLNRHGEAEQTWTERRRLVRGPVSGCSLFLEAQVLAHRIVATSDAAQRSTLRGQLETLLSRAVQLEGKIDFRSASQRQQLIDQIDRQFQGCYLGLSFNTAAVLSALAE